MRGVIYAKDKKRMLARGMMLGQTLWLHVNGETWVIENKKRKKASTSHNVSEENEVLAPMPGKILRLAVKAGEAVEKDQVMVVMEAMKMEYSLVAPKAGRVEIVNCSEGQQVELGRILVRLEKP